MKYKFIYLLIYFICYSNLGNILELDFNNSQEQNFKLIDNALQDPLAYKELHFKPDYKVSEQELEYLTGIPKSGILTPDLLKRAYIQLKQKNKFKTLKADLSEKVILDLESDWSISKIKFKSNLQDKEQYKSLYLTDLGQIFDSVKHKISLENIKQKLFQNGYCDANILDQLIYDTTTKTVEIILNLENTNIFKISEPEIDIVSTDKELVNKIQKKLNKIISKKLLNKNYSEPLVNNQIEELKNYLASIGFLNPNVVLSIFKQEDNKIRTNIKIVLDKQKIFNFIGNNFFTSKQLFTELRLTDNFISILPPELILEDLINLYKQAGFWDVDISLKKEPCKFYFIISEGQRAKLINVSFTDNFNTNELFNNFLKQAFKNFKKQEISDKELSKSLNGLKTKFIQAGFWDYNLSDKQFIKINENEYKLILDIQPGKQRFINQVKIPNFPELESHSYFSYINNANQAQPFNENLISEQKRWLSNYFNKQNQHISEIKPEIKIEDDGTLTLIWHVISGQIKFGKTVITGNKNVPSYIILRELQYKENEPWSNIKIAQTIKRLKELNIFDSVILQPREYEHEYETNNHPVILKCIEDDQFEIKTRLGAQVVNKSFTRFSGTTYKIGGSFLYKNPFKQADIFQLDGDYTRFGYNFVASYAVPGIGNYPIRTRTSVYANTFEQKFMVPTTEKIYKESHEGVSVENNYLKTYDDSYWRYSLRSGIENMKISDISINLARTIDFSPILVDKRIAALYFEPVIAIDWLDNKIDPNSGIKTLLSGKALFPLNVNDAHFIKIFAEQAFYFPLIHSSHSFLPKLTLAARFRVGHIFTPDFKRVLPSDRFYLGGPESLRGYEPNMAPPLNSFIKDKKRIWVPIGSKSVANMNLELRFGVYKALSGVVFNDLGFLTQDFKSDIKLKNILGSTGFGLRCATPIGMLRFDMGFKWKKRHPDDKIYAWFFAFGHAF